MVLYTFSNFLQLQPIEETKESLDFVQRETFCARQWVAPPVKGDFGVIDREALKAADLTVMSTPEPSLVASALDDAAVMDGDGGVNQVAAQAPEARKGPVFVSTGESAVTDNVSDQNCCEFPGLGHWTLGPFGNLTRCPPQSCRKALKEPRT